MSKRERARQRIRELEERVKYLEEVNRFTLDALDMAASLADFQPNINKLQEPSAILDDARSRIKRLTSFQTTAFFLVDEATSDFYLASCDPPGTEPFVQEEVRQFIDNGTFGWALRENRPTMVSSSDFEDQIVLHVIATSARVRGMFVGVLERGKNDVPDISLSLLSIILLNSANALESFELYKMISDINKDLEEKVKERTKQLEYHALHDPLTDLPNRVLIFDRLEYEIRASQRKNKEMAFLLIDLDRFKDVNDSLGHHAGDVLLVEFGRRLRNIVRDTDTIARLGGDEFGVFLPEVHNLKNTVDVCRRILKSMEEPFLVEDQYISVDASIGVAMIPAHGKDKDTILRKADVAMYAAKRTKSGYAVFDSDHGEGNLDRLTLMGELRRAIDKEELLLYYQPKVNIATGQICGVEALLRWLNPKRGFVSPGEFIPLAEQGGLIKAVTLKVIRMALRQQRLWLQSGLDIPAAVNLSALNVQDPELPNQIAGMLEEFQVSPACLELEITESTIMTTPNRGLKVIQELNGMGIKLSIDDFGTGYSSLAYLKKLPVQVIKIDLSFVVNMHKDETDAKIVQSIIELGHNLGMEIVAEGVENSSIWEKLAEHGCDMAQGYLISRPLPPEEFGEWMAGSTWTLPRGAVEKKIAGNWWDE